MKLETLRLRRVLCALDVERTGSTSLSMASLLAERFHASVDALYATAPATALPSQSEPVKRLITKHSAQDRLSGLVASMTRRVCVSSYVTRGAASTVIVSHSERHSSDLIVMATSPHQRFGAAANTIASVAAKAPCAVLTVGGRFQPSPLRRILLPIGPAGVQRYASDWVAALASRFDAEVGVLRIEPPRTGFWTTFTSIREPAASATRPEHAETENLLARLRQMGIDAYEIEHPGGSDAEVICDFCESGAFDAIVMGLPVSDDDKGAHALAASVRLKTSAPVLSVRAIRSPVLFAPNHPELLPAAAGADWAQL